MPITLLDGILVGFTLVSAMLAMVRGFSREFLSIASWVAAGAAGLFFYPQLMPYVETHIDQPQLAMWGSIAIIFFIVLVVVTIVTMKIADIIIDSSIGALDRTLGFLYGAARGILVVAIALAFYNGLAGSSQIAWINEAKSRPMLDQIGSRLIVLFEDINGWVRVKIQENPDNPLLAPLLSGEDAPAQGSGSEAAPNAADAPASPSEATGN